MSLVYNTCENQANIFQRFSEECAKIEAHYKEDGYPSSDIERDNKIIAVYDKYVRKYGNDWF